MSNKSNKKMKTSMPAPPRASAVLPVALSIRSITKGCVETRAESAICTKEHQEEGGGKAGEKAAISTRSTPAVLKDTVAVGSVKSGRAVSACERTTLAAENLHGSKSRGLQCSVKRSMIFAQFSEEEANNKALQRRVQRCMERMIKAPPTYLEMSTKKEAEPELSALTSSKEVALINLEELAKISGLKLEVLESKLALLTNPPPTATPPVKSKDESSLKKGALAPVLLKESPDTPKQAHIKTVNKYLKKRAHDDAYGAIAKKVRYERENLPPNSQSSVVSIVSQVNLLYNTSLKPNTVRRHLKDDLGPPGRGRKSLLPPLIIEALGNAISSFVALACEEKEKIPRRQGFIAMLKSCLVPGPCLLNDYVNLYRRLLPTFAGHLKVTKNGNKIEERRLKWTTYNNINTWFSKLKEELIAKGFARLKRDDEICEGEIVFFSGQLNRIINLDESGLTLDGSGSQAGGRPSTAYGSSDAAIGCGAERTNKSSSRITLVAGSNAAGYPLPPHFQLKSTTTEDEKKRIHEVFVDGVPNTNGIYGGSCMTSSNGATVNCNVNAGMDGDEFEKYILDAILKLYPDAADLPGKRVMLIVDSGPGRNNEKLLASLAARGFLLHPGVPNTTHVTQPTDRNYGYFKTLYRKNLEKLAHHRRKTNDNLRQSDYPLLVFGKCAGWNENVVLDFAFDEAFSVERFKDVWRTIGISPFTRKCLEDEKVQHELIVLPDRLIDLTTDPKTAALISHKKRNTAAIKVLNDSGFNGEVLRKYAPRKSQRLAEPVTEPNTRARQDAIAGVKYSSQHFIATGGETLNTKDYFIAKERTRRLDEIKHLETKKKIAKAAQVLNSKALRFIQNFASKGIDVKKDDDAKTIPVSTLKVLCQWKQQKKIPAKKDKLLDMWIKVKNDPTPPSASWTDSDEALLQRLKDDEITIRETAYGRERERSLKNQALATDARTDELLRTIRSLLQKGMKDHTIPTYLS